VSAGEIVAAFIVSTVGLSVFVYGKKQRRLPQLFAGMALIGAPVIVHDPLWLGLTAVALLVAVKVAIRYER
jgi:hypothetical protein